MIKNTAHTQGLNFRENKNLILSKEIRMLLIKVASVYLTFIGTFVTSDSEYQQQSYKLQYVSIDYYYYCFNYHYCRCCCCYKYHYRHHHRYCCSMTPSHKLVFDHLAHIFGN